jgi:hypothetical protein
MGNAQSSGAPEISRTILIDEWEVPESYKSVAVSEEVVDAVVNATPRVQTSAKIVVAPDPHLK